MSPVCTIDILLSWIFRFFCIYKLILVSEPRRFQFKFSESGRHAWIFIANSIFHYDMWYQIPKIYPLKADDLNHRARSVWHDTVLFDQKVFAIRVSNDGVNVHLLEKLNDKTHFTHPSYFSMNQFVRITSRTLSSRSKNVYLLPGFGEEDPVRVLFVLRSGREAIIKFLPITMKEILDNLDELAENRHSLRRLALKARSASPSRPTSEAFSNP